MINLKASHCYYGAILTATIGIVAAAKNRTHLVGISAICTVGLLLISIKKISCSLKYLKYFNSLSTKLDQSFQKEQNELFHIADYLLQVPIQTTQSNILLLNSALTKACRLCVNISTHPLDIDQMESDTQSSVLSKTPTIAFFKERVKKIDALRHQNKISKIIFIRSLQRSNAIYCRLLCVITNAARAYQLPRSILEHAFRALGLYIKIANLEKTLSKGTFSVKKAETYLAASNVFRKWTLLSILNISLYEEDLSPRLSCSEMAKRFSASGY
jgi:hypothetical protein